MAFILLPKNGDSVHVNGWNWRPTLVLVRAKELISDSEYEQLGANGCGGEVSAIVAYRIADIIGQQLATMQPGERLLADLTVSMAAQKEVTLGAAMAADPDVNDLYSATYEWLATFQDFLQNVRWILGAVAIRTSARLDSCLTVRYRRLQRSKHVKLVA